MKRYILSHHPDKKDVHWDPHPTTHAATFPPSIPPKTLADGKTLGEERKLEGLEALVAQAKGLRALSLAQ